MLALTTTIFFASLSSTVYNPVNADESVFAAVHSTAILSCRIDVDAPSNDLRWEFDIPPSQHVTVFNGYKTNPGLPRHNVTYETGTSKLTIANIQITDVGRYRCYRAGTGQASEFQLIIPGDPATGEVKSVLSPPSVQVQTVVQEHRTNFSLNSTITPTTTVSNITDNCSTSIEKNNITLLCSTNDNYSGTTIQHVTPIHLPVSRSSPLNYVAVVVLSAVGSAVLFMIVSCAVYQTVRYVSTNKTRTFPDVSPPIPPKHSEVELIARSHGLRVPRLIHIVDVPELHCPSTPLADLVEPAPKRTKGYEHVLPGSRVSRMRVPYTKVIVQETPATSADDGHQQSLWKTSRS